MKYIKFTYVDSITGISIASHPTENGSVFPDVDSLEFLWGRESAYPTSVPEFFGTCSDAAFTMIDGVIDVLNQQDFENMRADEMRARIPQSITMRQARLSLLASGMLTTVNSAIARMSGAAGEAARIEWEYAHEVRRNAGLMESMGVLLGLSSAQLDDLFVAASRL